MILLGHEIDKLLVVIQPGEFRTQDCYVVEECSSVVEFTFGDEVLFVFNHGVTELAESIFTGCSWGRSSSLFDL